MSVPERANSRGSSIFPAVLLICASMLPSEVRLDLADQTFYVWRLVGMALLPWALYDIVRNPIKFRIWDAAIAISVYWMVFAFMAYYGPTTGFLRGIALAIDVAIPYIIGRLSIRSLSDFRKLLLFITPALALLGLSILLESVTFRPLVRPAAEAIFGPLPRYDSGNVVAVGGELNYDRRLGLIRAAGPFSHPILAGLFMLSFLPLFLQAGNRGWPPLVAIAASVVGVLSLSSAALLLLLMGLSMVAADRIQKNTTFITWPLMIGCATTLLLLAHLLSSKGIVSALGRYTLNPQTARFRELIWQYGTQSVSNHPWIGIGFDNYERLEWMVPSVDNNWLLLAIRFGVIPPFAILASILVILFALARNAKRSSEVDRKLYVGLAIAVFSTTLLGFTVAFFGGFQSWYYLLLGAAGSCAAPAFSALSQGPRHSPISVQSPRPAPVQPSISRQSS